MVPIVSSAIDSVSSQPALIGVSGRSGLPVPIAAGIRWTLWLSLLALPCSYATNVLLARIGPEALGTFGVLNVYIGIVSGFFSSAGVQCL